MKIDHPQNKSISKICLEVEYIVKTYGEDVIYSDAAVLEEVQVQWISEKSFIIRTDDIIIQYHTDKDIVLFHKGTERELINVFKALPLR